MVISFINYKGGVGKTTLTSNIGAALCLKGKKVLMVDLDPQCSLTFSFLKTDAWKREFNSDKTVKALFDTRPMLRKESTISNLIIKMEERNNIFKNLKIHLISSHMTLQNVEQKLAHKLEDKSVRREKINYVTIHSQLSRALKPLEVEYDYILFDCPPSFNIITKNALVASDYYIVPSKLDFLSTVGISELISLIGELVNEYNGTIEKFDLRREKILPDLLGVACTMVGYKNGNILKAHEEYLRQIKQMDIPIFNTFIKENKTFYADAPQYGVPVVMQAKNGSTYESIIDELMCFTSEMEERLINYVC